MKTKTTITNAQLVALSNEAAAAGDYATAADACRALAGIAAARARCARVIAAAAAMAG